MDYKLIPLLALAFLCAFNTQLSAARGQTSAFTYHGQLTDTGSPALGGYDLQFTLYALEAGGNPVAGPTTKAATEVAAGVFAVMLDFGVAVLDGNDRWLEIGAMTNGAGPFETLMPRRPITSTPYALRAWEASSVPLGTVTSDMLTEGAVGSHQLASVSAAANPAESGQAGVASGGLVMSETEKATLVEAGYAQILSSSHSAGAEQKHHFEDLPGQLQNVLRVQLLQAGDISAVIEMPGGFLLYLAQAKTPETLTVATLSLPKRDCDEWINEQSRNVL